ncbi:MAG: coproporphyrinogen dehydrogenase HemZ [Eubacterium sp.]
MILRNINHSFGYHTQKIATMFFPLEKIKVDVDGEDNKIVDTIKKNNKLTVSAKVYSKSTLKSIYADENEDMAHAMSLLLYNVLADITGFYPSWGILYGVRPARLMHATVEKFGEKKAKERFISDLVQPEKVELALEVMRHENEIIKLSGTNSFSLYVSIPFCPTRCSYCSFVSHSIQNAKNLIEPYVDLLCRELIANGRIAKELNLRLETIYFGGGTPTTLSDEQLDRILSVIEYSFDLSALREYTVEAGRPDTVTKAKLDTLKAHDVGRISINPQTFNDRVLAHIGRKHSSKQTIAAYELARDCGFDNINMDFIAGLNSDTLNSFKASIDKAVELGAESITVHNLALKSGAYLVTENEYYDLSLKNTASDMINYSYEALKNGGYYPYYMYRQSKSLGNLENVGWCRKGYDCLYNVYMMDETHTVFAAGAGAVTKLKNQSTGHIERIYNYKYPYEYIDNFDEMLKRKQRILDFYQM